MYSTISFDTIEWKQVFSSLHSVHILSKHFRPCWIIESITWRGCPSRHHPAEPVLASTKHGMPVFAPAQVKFIEKQLPTVSASSPRELIIVEFNGGLRREDEIRMEGAQQTNSTPHRDSDDEGECDLRSRMTDGIRRTDSAGVEAFHEGNYCDADAVHAARPHVEEEEVEIPVIIKTDTVADPRAEMIHS